MIYDYDLEFLNFKQFKPNSAYAQCISQAKKTNYSHHKKQSFT